MTSTIFSPDLPEYQGSPFDRAIKAREYGLINRA
jgi:hypothetical protein